MYSIFPKTHLNEEIAIGKNLFVCNRMLRKLTNPLVVKIREMNKNVKNRKANICQALGLLNSRVFLKTVSEKPGLH